MDAFLAVGPAVIAGCYQGTQKAERLMSEAIQLTEEDKKELIDDLVEIHNFMEYDEEPYPEMSEEKKEELFKSFMSPPQTWTCDKCKGSGRTTLVN